MYMYNRHQEIGRKWSNGKRNKEEEGKEKNRRKNRNKAFVIRRGREIKGGGGDGIKESRYITYRYKFPTMNVIIMCI